MLTLRSGGTANGSWPVRVLSPNPRRKGETLVTDARFLIRLPVRIVCVVAFATVLHAGSQPLPTRVASVEATATSGSLLTIARWLLAGLLLFAGVGHLVNGNEFIAQVPPWLPFPEAIVIASGIVEIALAVCLLALPRQRVQVGWVVAAFFVIVFPGNVSQFVTHTAAFGLDSDLSRGIRLLLQPVLVAWALWCTGAWQTWRTNRKASHHP